LFLIGLFVNGLLLGLIILAEQRIDSRLAVILMAIAPLTTIALVHISTTDERLTVNTSISLFSDFPGLSFWSGPRR